MVFAVQEVRGAEATLQQAVSENQEAREEE